MSALANVVEFQLPKRKPKIVEKVGNPDQRSFSVVPLRAARDKRLTAGDIRALVILCSYCNRAGLTWVSQKRVGEDLGVSRQSIGKHLKHLKDCGYIKQVGNAFKGEKANTLQIVYQDGITPEDAVAITSSIEDTRSPEMIKADREAAEKPKERLASDGLPEMSEEQAAANRERLKAMLANWSSPNFRTHQPQHIGDLMPRARPKKTGNPEVASDAAIGNPPVASKQSHRQPHRQPTGCATGNPPVAQSVKNTGNSKVVYELLKERFNGVIGNQNELIDVLLDCMTDEQAVEMLQLVEGRYQAEGLQLPSMPTVINDMILMHSARHLEGATRG